MPAQATIATINNVPQVSGYGSETHVIYAINGALYWAFWLDSTDTSTLRCASSPDMVTWTARTSLSLANIHSSDGRLFSVGYKNIASTDVVHETFTENDATIYHARATMSGSTITWSIDTSSTFTTSLAAGHTPGSSVTIATDGTPFSSITTNGSDEVLKATNTDSGSSWIAGWGKTTIFTTASWANSSAVIPLASGNVLYIGDNGSGANNWNDHEWSLWNGTSWSAATAVNGGALANTQNPADWGWAKRSNTDVHVIRRTGASSFDHYRYNGTNFSTGDAIDALSTNSGAGVTCASDGTNVWAFTIASAAGNDVYVNRWTAGVGWSGWTAFGLVSATRTKIGCCQTANGTTIAVYWTEGATSPFNFVGYPYSTVPPSAPTAVDCTVQSGQVRVTWLAPSSIGGSPITSYTVTASPGGATAVTADGNTLVATVQGLTNGTTYTFTVHATNSGGNSAESVASGPATPYVFPNGAGLGAGFSGRLWSGASASTPSGYIWGFVGRSGGEWNRWEMLARYCPRLDFQAPNPPLPFLTAPLAPVGFQLGANSFGSAATEIIPSSVTLTLNTVALASQGSYSTASIALTEGTLTLSIAGIELFSASVVLQQDTIALSTTTTISGPSTNVSGNLILDTTTLSIAAIEVWLATLTIVQDNLSLGTQSAYSTAATILTLSTSVLSVTAGEILPASIALALLPLTLSALAQTLNASVVLVQNALLLAIAASEVFSATIALVQDTLLLTAQASTSVAAFSLTLDTIHLLIGTGGSAQATFILDTLTLAVSAGAFVAALSLTQDDVILSITVSEIVSASAALMLGAVLLSAASQTFVTDATLRQDDLLLSALTVEFMFASCVIVLDALRISAQVSYVEAAILLTIADLLLGSAIQFVPEAVLAVLLADLDFGAIGRPFRPGIPLFGILFDLPAALGSVIDVPAARSILTDGRAAVSILAGAGEATLVLTDVVG